MGTDFCPTLDDVERYRRLRGLSMELKSRIIKTIPRKALQEVGRAIGILRKGVLVFDTEDMASVLMDCCLYDWFENGENIVQRYSQLHPAKPWTDEDFLLKAFLRARYRLLVVRSSTPGAGLHCDDVLNDEELFLMDVGFSHSAGVPGLAIATRTVPIGKYWMTTGAGLPINSEALRRMERLRFPAKLPGATVLSIVRACLAAGAPESISYCTPQNAESELKKAQRERRWRWF